MVSVGLTGGFASGKTTVAKMLVKKGAKFLSADEIVHGLLKNSHICRAKILRVFGREVLSRGQVDRRKLAKKVFADPILRKTLERIIHPEVIRDIKKRLHSAKKSLKHKVFVVEVPLLFEAGLERFFDFNVVVLATRKQQIQRALQTRSMNRQEILLRMKAQLPLSDKRRMADILIDNRGSFIYTQRQVNELWRRLSKKA